MCRPLISVASLLNSGTEDPPTHAQLLLLVVSCTPLFRNLDSSSNYITKPTQQNTSSHPSRAKSMVSIRGVVTLRFCCSLVKLHDDGCN
jgi:hypothetical protein